MSGSVDVAVASTSDTLERAKTVGFTIPYYSFENAVVANEKIEMSTWEDMKGKVVGATAGTYEAIWLEGKVKEWGEGEFRPYQTQADVFLALSQGQLDATVATVEVSQANVKSGNYPGIKIVDKTYSELYAISISCEITIHSCRGGCTLTIGSTSLTSCTTAPPRKTDSSDTLAYSEVKPSAVAPPSPWPRSRPAPPRPRAWRPRPPPRPRRGSTS